MRADRFIVSGVLVLLAMGSGPRAEQQRQQPQQPLQGDVTFRSTTRLIVQTVTVRDKDGRAIEGLTTDDFTVTEDGQPQAIAFVEFQRLPSPGSTPASAVTNDAARAPTVTPAVPTQISAPTPGRVRYRDRRLLVLYLDLTSMPTGDQMRAYGAAQTYVTGQMTSVDLVAIMTYQGAGVRVKQDFTDNRARLLQVLNVLIYGEDQDGDGIPDMPDTATAFGQGDAEFNIFNTDRQLSALQTAVSMLGPLPEQKTLLYFGSGLRLNGLDNHAQLRATTNAAIRANVTINPVDARGLVAQAPLGDATQRSPGGIGMFSGKLAETTMTNFQRSQDTLHALAKDTGGLALFDYNDLSRGIVQAADAVSSYYVLGFYSTHTDQDGRFHRVKVTLKGGIAGEVAHRQGYFADKTWTRFSTADKERQLEEALMLENPITDIPIAMEVNYFQLNRAEYFVPVAIKIPGSELALARRRGAARTHIDFIGEIKDDYGITIQNVRDKLDIKLSEATANQLASRPLQYETGFTLLPGKYVLKFLARDAETGRIGTFQAAFSIPNLMREDKRLPISSVVLASQRVPLADALHSVKDKAALTVNPLVLGRHKLVPSVTRVFSRDRDLYVFLQAYQRGAAATQPLVVFVTFYRDDAKVFETSPVIVTEELRGRSNAVPVTFSLPLASLPPGRYDCQVTVLDSSSQKAAFWRAPIMLVQ